MAGWHHRLNGHELEQDLRVGDGQGGLVCYSPWGQEELDRTEWLNWTELKRLWGASRGGFSWRLSLWLVSSRLLCIRITSVFSSSFKDTSPIEAHSFVVVQLLFMSTNISCSLPGSSVLYYLLEFAPRGPLICPDLTLIISLKALSLNIVTLAVRVSIYELWEPNLIHNGEYSWAWCFLFREVTNYWFCLFIYLFFIGLVYLTRPPKIM